MRGAEAVPQPQRSEQPEAGPVQPAEELGRGRGDEP